MKKTPLNATHIALGARMVDFGGWHMPVQYSGLTPEHQATRTTAGLFDVSHMGEVSVEGSGAEDFLNLLVTNNVSKLVDGQAQYTVMCYENGGTVDDLLVYKRATNKYLLCINASNTEKDFAWIEKLAATQKNVTVKNISDAYCQIAIQGPKATQILQSLTTYPLQNIKYYHFAETNFLGADSILSRTGYTGEDGFEIYAPADNAVKIWDSLMNAGKNFDILPCGLGARDTLRTEMKMPLYGHELSAEINPLEAGLGWVVKFDKANFVGKDALAKIKATGLTQISVGIRVHDKGIARQGYDVFNAEGNKKIGTITSGTLSPSLGYAIAIAQISMTHKEVGTKISVKIRDRLYNADVVGTPFYKRPY